MDPEQLFEQIVQDFNKSGLERKIDIEVEESFGKKTQETVTYEQDMKRLQNKRSKYVKQLKLTTNVRNHRLTDINTENAKKREQLRKKITAVDIEIEELKGSAP